MWAGSEALKGMGLPPPPPRGVARIFPLGALATLRFRGGTSFPLSSSFTLSTMFCGGGAPEGQLGNCEGHVPPRPGSYNIDPPPPPNVSTHDTPL